MIEVKRGTIEEVIELNNLIGEFEEKEITEKLDIINKGTLIILIAYDGEKKMGFSISYDKYNDGSIYAWFATVMKEYRGQGIYSLLAKERESLAKSKGYSSIVLKTRNKRREMLSYLVKNDWNIIEFEKNNTDELENKIVFKKNISK